MSALQVLGVVPARAGSKGIPGKNLVLIAGKPLVHYTFAAIAASSRLTRAIVTTDDDAVANVARACGIDVPFMRPAGLATDETPMLDVLRHATSALGHQGYVPDIVVLLQPTSPLRRGAHIDAVVNELETTKADAVVTVVQVPHACNPVSVMRLEAGRLSSFLPGPVITRRQDKPVLFARNGPAVLAVRRQVLEQGSLYGEHTRAIVMSEEESVDIDSVWDLQVAEAALRWRAERQGF